METHLANSQFLSRKDVRAWFWDGTAEFSGECRALADNGIILQVKRKLPGTSTELDASKSLPSVRRQLVGRKLEAELSSPKVKGQVRIEVRQVDLVSAQKKLYSVVAVFPAPPDPKFLKLLLEPVVVKLPKK